MTPQDPYTLAKGAHPNSADGRCAMEWVAFIAGEKHSDRPVCVSPFLQSFCIAFNDRLGDEDRQKLRPYLARTIGTHSDGLDAERVRICREWIVKTVMPDWLSLAGKHELAAQLRSMPDALVQENALPLIRQAQDEAKGARGKARARLRDEVKKALVGLPADAADAADAAADAAAAAAAADAAAAAYAPSLDEFRQRIYDRVKVHCDAKLKPIRDRHTAMGFELLDRMLPTVTIDLPESAACRVRELEALEA